MREPCNTKLVRHLIEIDRKIVTDLLSPLRAFGAQRPTLQMWLRKTKAAVNTTSPNVLGQFNPPLSQPPSQLELHLTLSNPGANLYPVKVVRENSRVLFPT